MPSSSNGTNRALAKDCCKGIKAANARILKLGRKFLLGAAVVCSTLAGTLSHNLASLSFDLAVVDEVAQVSRYSSQSVPFPTPGLLTAL